MPDDLDYVLRRLQDLALADDGGSISWEEELPFGRSLLVAIDAWVDAGDAFLEVATPIIDHDSERLTDIDLPFPLVGVGIIDGDQDGEGEAVLLVVSCSCPLHEGADGLRRLLGAAIGLLRGLAEDGVVRWVDMLVGDSSLALAALTLEDLKARRPQEAFDLACDLAGQCREAGDFVSAAFLEIGAAEIAEDLGDTRLCWELAAPAWTVLGQPLGDAVIVSVYACALQGIGHGEEGVDLLRRAEAASSDPADAALLRGNRGIVLARLGRFPDAVDVLQASLDDPSLPPRRRRELGLQLAEVRRSVGGDGRPSLEQMDVLDEADMDLNDIGQLLHESYGTAELTERLPAIEEAIVRLRARWALLGSGQRARVLMVEGATSFHRGELAAAGAKLRGAVVTATEAGNIELARWAANLEASFATGQAPVAGWAKGLSPVEQVMLTFNRAYVAVTAAIGRGVDERAAFEPALEPALEAVRAVDAERHEFTVVTDRGAWARFGARAYEFALTLATTLGDKSLVVELLERVHAQGLPDGRLGAGPQPTIRAALEALDVTTPRIATLSGFSGVAPVTTTPRLGDVVTLIGGREAWWWSCHTFGNRLYWALRAPDGRVDVGRRLVTEDGFPGFENLAAIFRTPSPDGYAVHGLVEDSGGRLDAVLRQLGELLLPPRLARTAAAAAEAGRPLRLVWAPPPTLSSLPVGLLPVDSRHRLLHAAVLTVAPPTSLVSAPGPVGGGPEGTAQETVVLGDDEDLHHGAGIVGQGGLGVPPARVLGSAAHVAADPPIAAALARPDTVVEGWAARPALTLYYGHVDGAGPGSPLATSLRLTDGKGPAPLEAGSLLVGERRGAPGVVVLCGCSSLEPSSMGTGEWWGFGVALLWQGSRQVVGSLWDLIDCPATARFAVELVTRLRSGDDPPAVLRRLQLEWLARWERGGRQRFLLSEADCHPILWAGWAATGIRSG